MKKKLNKPNQWYNYHVNVWFTNGNAWKIYKRTKNRYNSRFVTMYQCHYPVIFEHKFYMNMMNWGLKFTFNTYWNKWLVFQ